MDNLILSKLVEAVKSGKMTIDQVPVAYREQVIEALK